MGTKRRQFIKRGTLLAFSSYLGADIVFAHLLPKDYIPVALDQLDFYSKFKKDSQMVILNERPWNAEAKAHILDDQITPANRMFVRNNGHPPTVGDPHSWTLTIDGESVVKEKVFSLAALKKFPKHTYQLTLECGGNGRSEFDPQAKGNQWTVGAVSCANWTGVRLRDILADVGIKENAVYVGYHGKDTHLSGDPRREPISRGIPIQKAMMDETLVAYEMNGSPIPAIHGFPLRLVAGGWPASASGKWIARLSIRNKEHDGAKMGGQSYRVPCHPIQPGSQINDSQMCIIESMPVKSLITFPKSGALIKEDRKLSIRGHAWAGEQKVIKVEYSIDFGSTWKLASLKEPVNRLAWQHWDAAVTFPAKGYYEIWAKATDENGESQPMVVPGWNPKGYLNNACHRIGLKVT